MPSAILIRLGNQVEDFLPRWTENMGKAGYLESTTAKRQDCILSYHFFMEPLLHAVEQEHNPSFAELIQNSNNWAGKIIDTARRHRSRGVTGDMFIGCFKTLVHSVLEMIDDGDEPLEQKTAAVRFVRKWADAFETIVIQDWTTLSMQEAHDSLDRANRRLTLEKCKYENIINSISDLVFVLDANGTILEANRSARQYFNNEPENVPIWDFLYLEGNSMEEVLARYPKNALREIVLDDAIFFHCVFIPLKVVSLSSDGYLAILRDVSWHVKQREILEATVAERTAALQDEKVQLQEMNITLRTVMKSVDKELEAFQESVGEIVRTTLLPALNILRRKRSEPIRKSYIDILEDQLLRLPQGGGGYDSNALLLKLTPMEMKVCQFIQAGAATKDIAEAFNLSIVTIQTHRRNIRRKLDLQNSNMNLFTFLNNAERFRAGRREETKKE
jgi:DNA-binding CsgD family transcriptional regulator/PAS domain-containing protein